MAPSSTSLIQSVRFQVTYESHKINEVPALHLHLPFTYKLIPSLFESPDSQSSQAIFTLEIKSKDPRGIDDSDGLEGEIIATAAKVTGTIGCRGNLVKWERVSGKQGRTNSRARQGRTGSFLHLLSSSVLTLKAEQSGKVQLDIELFFHPSGTLDQQLDRFNRFTTPRISTVELCVRQLDAPTDLILYCESPESSIIKMPPNQSRNIYVHRIVVTTASDVLREVLATPEQSDDRPASPGSRFWEEDSDREVEPDEEEVDQATATGVGGSQAMNREMDPLEERLEHRRRSNTGSLARSVRAFEADSSTQSSASCSRGGRAFSASPDTDEKPVLKKPRLFRDPSATAPVEVEEDSSKPTPAATRPRRMNRPNVRRLCVPNCEYTTLRAVVVFIYTKQIEFAPLSINGIDQRARYVQDYAKRYPNRPIPVSCRSVHRLAEMLELEDLSQLALRSLKNNLNVTNAVELALSLDARCYPNFRKVVHDFVRKTLPSVENLLNEALVGDQVEGDEELPEWKYELLGRLVGPVLSQAKFSENEETWSPEV